MSDENNMPKGRERPTGPCDCGRVEHGRHHADCPASGVFYSDKYPAASPAVGEEENLIVSDREAEDIGIVLDSAAARENVKGDRADWAWRRLQNLLTDRATLLSAIRPLTAANAEMLIALKLAEATFTRRGPLATVGAQGQILRTIQAAIAKAEGK